MCSWLDVEPFDKALAEQVQKLEAEYEHQALALAEKRRHVPKQLRQVMKGTVEAKTSAVLGNVARYPNTATDGTFSITQVWSLLSV